MRDLAPLRFSGNRPSRFSRLIKLLVIVLVVGGVVWVLKNRNSSAVGGQSESLHEAPRGLKPVSADSGDITTGGVNLTTQSATFKDVKYQGQAKAVATRSFGGGTYILNVEATLPDPVNIFYEVWVVGDGKVTPIDYMSGSKNNWSLHLKDSDKFSKYDGIWITLERLKDTSPEEHVLEGTFKQ